MISKTVAVQGKREYMEDTYISSFSQKNNYYLFGVFDGHGGDEVSIFCKNEFPKRLDLQIQKAGCYDICNTKSMQTQTILTQGQMAHIVANTFLDIDKEIVKLYPRSVGSTASIVMITPKTIYTANCGDSSIMIGYKKGYDMLSRDHKVGDPVEMDRLKKQGANITMVPGDTPRIQSMLNLSRSLGDAHLKRYVLPNPFMSIVPVSARIQYILIASDGLWDVFEHIEVHQFVIKYILSFPTVTDAMLELYLNELVQLAIDKGSTDNITVNLILIH